MLQHRSRTRPLRRALALAVCAAACTSCASPAGTGSGSPPDKSANPGTPAQQQAATQMQQSATRLEQPGNPGAHVDYQVTARAWGDTFKLPVTVSWKHPKGMIKASGAPRGKQVAGVIIDDGVSKTTMCTTKPQTVCVTEAQTESVDGWGTFVPQEVVQIVAATQLLASGGATGLQGSGPRTVLGRRAMCGTYHYTLDGQDWTVDMCVDVKTGAPLVASFTARGGETVKAVATAIKAPSAADFQVPKSSVDTGAARDRINDAADDAGSAADDARDRVGDVAGGFG